MTSRDIEHRDVFLDARLASEAFAANRLPGTPLVTSAILGAARCLADVLIRVEFDGLGNLPRGPYLLAANHMSAADSVLLPAFLPRRPRLYLVGNQHTVWRSWWRRAWVRSFGQVIPVNLRVPVDMASFRRCQDVLEAGNALLVFPEGDEGCVEGQLLPLKDGVAVLAQRTGVPIIPVAISGTREIWLHKQVRIVIGEPFRARRGGRNAAQETTSELRRRILDLMPEYREDPAEPKRLRFLSRLI
jgi:1-acyl-sn-glycerol-3-phosphate acyltransferase